jgi:hypothetical protein
MAATENSAAPKGGIPGAATTVEVVGGAQNGQQQSSANRKIKQEELKPSRGQIVVFAEALFRYAFHAGIAAKNERNEDCCILLRGFLDLEDGSAGIYTGVPLVAGIDALADRAVAAAWKAANNPKPTVFCPPVCVFNGKAWDVRAREVDIRYGVAISVECDAQPRQALECLTAILGAPTVAVASGGLWTSPDGIVEPKGHAHWRLATLAADQDELAKLKRARALACALAGGDRTAKPICHPLRWPGSWHRKGKPRPCHISECNPDTEIDLNTALAALETAAAAAGIKIEEKTEALDWTMPDGSTVSSLAFSPCMAAPPAYREPTAEDEEALKLFENYIVPAWMTAALNELREPSDRGLAAVKRIFDYLNRLGTPNSGDDGRHLGLYKAARRLGHLVVECEIAEEICP